MKTRLKNNREVAHVWASQNQEEGRGSSFFFEGPSIFSYGHHFEIARIVRPGVVLFNESSYSVSTSKHQGYARSAVSHMRVFRIPGLKWQADINHNESAKYYIQTLNNSLFCISRMRKDPQWRLGIYASLAEEAAAYVLEFGKDIQKPLQRAIADIYEKRENPLTPDQLEKMKARAKTERENAKKQRIEKEQREAQDKKEELAKLEAWKNGEGVSVSMRYDMPTYLRIKGKEIETSRGASVPLIEARKLWHIMEAGASIDGVHIGHYTVTRLQDQNLVIGCHTIPLEEVKRIASQMGLTKI